MISLANMLININEQVTNIRGVTLEVEKSQATKNAVDTKILDNWKYIYHNWIEQKSEEKTLLMIERGIPICFRKQIWALSLPNRQTITQDFYDSKLEEGIFFMGISEKISLTQSKLNSLKFIDIDIARTFPEISRKNSYKGLFCYGSPIKESLRRVLIAFTCYRSDVGYVQGMSYIGGLLLMYFEEYECFVRFVSLVTAPSLLPLFQLHGTKPLLLQRLSSFQKLLQINLPLVSKHFERLGVHPSTYLVEWIMTLYSKTLNPDMTSRIWDLFFSKGVEILWKTAVAILKLIENQIIVEDICQIYKCFKSIREQLLDEDLLIKILLQVKYPKELAQEFKEISVL